jgi:hypothetical protein
MGLCSVQYFSKLTARSWTWNEEVKKGNMNKKNFQAPFGS